MAFGFETGQILLYRGDVTRERHSKHRVIYEDVHPITGLEFCNTQNDIFLFATTEYHVISITIGVKDKSDVSVILDQQGCAVRINYTVLFILSLTSLSINSQNV